MHLSKNFRLIDSSNAILESSGQTFEDTSIFKALDTYIDERRERFEQVQLMDWDIAQLYGKHLPKPVATERRPLTLADLDAIDRRSVDAHLHEFRRIQNYGKLILRQPVGEFLHDAEYAQRHGQLPIRYEVPSLGIGNFLGDFGANTSTTFVGTASHHVISTPIPNNPADLKNRQLVDVAYSLRALDRHGLDNLPKSYLGYIAARCVRKILQ
jgi:hypothetical protein